MDTATGVRGFFEKVFNVHPGEFKRAGVMFIYSLFAMGGAFVVGRTVSNALFLANLDERYYLINNLKLPGRADDIDHIVVGPNGIFALETKHHRGRIFSRNGQWYQAKVSRSGRPQPEGEIRDPTQQLKRNVDYLRSCINRTDPALSRRTRLWIEGVVVFTHPAVSLDLPEEVLAGLPFPVLRARDLPAHILKHVPRHPYSRHDARQIVSMFGHLQPGYPPCSDDPA